MQSKVSNPEFFALTIYLFINTLFVYKYTSRFTSTPWLWIACYLICISALVFLFYKDFDLKIHRKTSNSIFVVSVVFISLTLTLIMLHFDPGHIRVGRFPALEDWIARLLNGQYPYISPTRPSGFPFLFLLAMPFYLLGDLGLLQIFAFLIYVLILRSRYGGEGTNRVRTLILLTTSPVFLYEIAVRSDLFSNMVLVILYMMFCENRVRDTKIPALLIMGFVGGLLLATRGIVLLIFLLYFGYLFKNQLKRGLLFLTGIITGFIIVILPFAFWNIEYFMRHGPFSIQTSYLPFWLSILLIFLCIYFAGRATSPIIVYRYITSMLFAAVFIAFVISLIGRGWVDTIFGDRFDISYFCFTLPFLLLLLDYGRASANMDGKVFGRFDRLLPLK
ncbi:MAG: hypothetical protein WBE28_06730 [bacterium]